LDLLQQKLGIPKFDNGDYFWHLPRMYPFYQVRIDNEQKIYICIKLDHPININLDNPNISYDNDTKLLWVIGDTWNDALINLYYVIFDLHDEKLMAKTKYILSVNKNFETKLVSDIYKKIQEITYNNQMDLKPEFRSDLAYEEKNEHLKPEKIEELNNVSAYNEDTKGSQLDNNWDFLPGDDQKSGNYFMFN